MMTMGEYRILLECYMHAFINSSGLIFEELMTCIQRIVLLIHDTLTQKGIEYTPH